MVISPRTYSLTLTVMICVAWLVSGCGGDGGGGGLPVALTGKITGTMLDTASWLPTSNGRVRAIAVAAAGVEGGGKTYVSARQGGPGEFEISLPEGTYTLESYTPDTIASSGREYLGQRLADVQVNAMNTTNVGNLYVPTIITADTYTSDGVLISGWHWLRDNPPDPNPFTDTSFWTFSSIRRDLLATLVAEFRLLVTNKVNGGAGFGTTITIFVAGNGVSWAQVVLPPNSKPPDAVYPLEYEGYQTYATTTLNKNYVTAAGGVDVGVGRPLAFPYHVATQQAALRLIEYPPPTPVPAWP
ncbi:MAG: hypothetical protein ACE5R4_14085 [Armatimonadota bacterium]